MNLLNKFTKKELELLNNVGIKIEDKDYTQDEMRRYETSIEDFIMSHSTKNGDISRLSSQYYDIINILTRR